MKRAAMLLTVLVMALTVNFPAFAGEWRQSGGQWWYENDDGSFAKGWRQIGDERYYFDGAGWLQEINVYLDSVSFDAAGDCYRGKGTLYVGAISESEDAVTPSYPCSVTIGRNVKVNWITGQDSPAVSVDWWAQHGYQRLMDIHFDTDGNVKEFTDGEFQ